ncbi:MAG: sigma-70 family RNA polymerase sigma factor [Candidatus Binatus sp.]|uniref:RNA polymerase sigma factor n=1 Tax=Candidatus Binatus sp. TaxID=2811406 RepID=UPI0027199927|nr:sigma-70 family RNA polymerase sigma factor [Candidatus Binatus sp.]MDO8430792.1 sigma-70 family RNA polymerase sigma factor [Candidatus Binatus sp.]
MRTPGRQDGDEAELIDRARNGDSEAFGVLVERYQRRVVGVALAVVKNQDDAIELAQETFVRAFENLKNFESRSSFSTWLYRIAANLSIDFWRREGRHVILRGEDAQNEIDRLPSLQGDSFKAVSRSELSERLKKALEQLTPEHRAVILLREVEGLSYDEISETLQCPRGTVMSRLHYARNHLRAILQDLSLN